MRASAPSGASLRHSLPRPGYLVWRIIFHSRWLRVGKGDKPDGIEAPLKTIGNSAAEDNDSLVTRLRLSHTMCRWIGRFPTSNCTGSNGQ